MNNRGEKKRAESIVLIQFPKKRQSQWDLTDKMSGGQWSQKFVIRTFFPNLNDWFLMSLKGFNRLDK